MKGKKIISYTNDYVFEFVMANKCVIVKEAWNSSSRASWSTVN